MKKIFSHLPFAFILGVALLNNACRKDHEHDTEKPTIQVIEPGAGDTLDLKVEDSIHVEFVCKDNDALHELTVKIKNSHDSVLYHDEPTVHDMTQIHYHHHFHATGFTSLTPLKLVIEAADHGENVQKTEIPFFIKP